jgi:hypothetical protein
MLPGRLRSVAITRAPACFGYLTIHFAGDDPQASEGDGTAPAQGAGFRAVFPGALLTLLSHSAAAAASPHVRPC